MVKPDTLQDYYVTHQVIYGNTSTDIVYVGRVMSNVSGYWKKKEFSSYNDALQWCQNFRD